MAIIVYLIIMGAEWLLWGLSDYNRCLEAVVRPQGSKSYKSLRAVFTLAVLCCNLHVFCSNYRI